MKVATLIALVSAALLVCTQLADASLTDEGPSSHQLFRFKKGFHFFRLRKSTGGSAADGCMINESALEGMEMAIKAARAGKLCDEDKQLLRVFIANLML